MPAAKKTKRPKTGTPKKSAARKRAAQSVSLSGVLAEAAWAEADGALAEALADLDELEAATKRTARQAALAQLTQSLARAGRKRGLTRIGQLGAKEVFDAGQHELSAAVAKPPKKVRIEARGVVRGAEVLAKARVKPAGRKKRP